MAHETELNAGFTVREPAWHGLWPVLADYPARAEAKRLAGQDWQVLEKPLAWYSPSTQDPAVGIEGWKGLIRSDDGSFLSAVKDTYEVVQNDVIWDIAEALLQTGDLQYETAGCLRHGRDVLVLVRLKEPIQIHGDNSPTLMYLLVKASHDGTSSIIAILTAVRVVCANTLAMALKGASDGSGASYRFRHTKNVHNRIEDARSVLGLAKTKLAEYQELAEELAAHPVSDSQAQLFVETFIPMPLVDGAVTDRVHDNIMKARTEVFRILDTSMTVPDEHRRTSYGLFCSGIEFLDHVRAYRSKETYFNRAFSDSGSLKSKLCTLALEVASL